MIGKRQIVDLPEPRLFVTEHQCFSTVCGCGHESQGVFPPNMMAPIQYGPRIQASVVYLMHQHMIPEDRLQCLMQDVFGVSLATDTMASMSARFAETVAPLQASVLEQAKAAPVKHLDETGFRIGGKTQWLHVISTPTLTHYRVSPKRKDLTPIQNMRGVVVHDHWKPYFQLEGVQHGLCNAHHLRELKALMEIEKEPWAQRMDRLLRTGHRLRNPPIDRIWCLYDHILASGLAFHEHLPAFSTGRKRRIGHNLLLRLCQQKEAVLRFLSAPNVPFTNNQAEQDTRMMKVKQKISGGFRTSRGAEIFAIIRGFISTARKQQAHILSTISLQLA